MKRAIAGLVGLVGLVSVAQAAPVTTEVLGRNKMQAGVEVSEGFGRDLNATLKGWDLPGTGQGELSTYLATFGYGVTDRLTVVAKLGSGNLSFDALEFGHSPAVGVEAVFDLWKHAKTGIEVLVGGQVLGLINPTATDELFKYDGSYLETQANVIVARNFEVKGYKVRPYVGFTYSALDADTELQFADFGVSERFRVNVANDHPIGVVLGASAQVWKELSVGVQGRLVDEEAVTVRVSYRI